MCKFPPTGCRIYQKKTEYLSQDLTSIFQKNQVFFDINNLQIILVLSKGPMCCVHLTFLFSGHMTKNMYINTKVNQTYSYFLGVGGL